MVTLPGNTRPINRGENTSTILRDEKHVGLYTYLGMETRSSWLKADDFYVLASLYFMKHLEVKSWIERWRKSRVVKVS